MFQHQRLKETLFSRSFPGSIKTHIDNFTVLIDGSPQTVLLAVAVGEHFIDGETIFMATIPSPESTGISGIKLYTQEATGFLADGDATIKPQALNNSVADIEFSSR